MTDVVSREGYAKATIAQVIAQAGVSRPTFYEYFTDRDDCFLTSGRAIGGQLIARSASAVSSGTPERALGSALAALVQFAYARPDDARFLFTETLAGGPRALDERDRIIAQIAQTVDGAHEQAQAGSAVPDLSSQIILGGVCRLLSTRLRDEEPDLTGFTEELWRWIETYEQPLAEHRWCALAPVPTAADSPPLRAERPLQAPAMLAPGRPRVSRAEVRENHRRRILAATAELAKGKGYSATTIADITRVARLDVRAFNASFAGKQDAFLTAHELGVQSTMAVTASAFFAAASWPERVWESGRAFTGFLEANPLVAHIGFVEAYAVGAGAVKRIEDSRIGFTIFLQEGYQAYPQERAPSRVALEAIAAATFELAYRLTRDEVQHGMASLLANVVHLALTPFLGSGEANRFIEEKLEQAASSAQARGCGA